MYEKDAYSVKSEWWMFSESISRGHFRLNPWQEITQKIFEIQRLSDVCLTLSLLSFVIWASFFSFHGCFLICQIVMSRRSFHDLHCITKLTHLLFLCLLFCSMNSIMFLLLKYTIDETILCQSMSCIEKNNIQGKCSN